MRETLGQIAAEAGMVDALVAAMEAKGTKVGDYFVPDRHMLYAAQTLTQQLYPKVVTTLRELAGGGMIMPAVVCGGLSPIPKLPRSSTRRSSRRRQTRVTA